MELLYILASIIAAETTYLTYAAVKTKRPRTKQSILLDTSALIDGRVVAIVRSGFVSARLIVPASVVRELQYMADKADHDKRERARYGLDVIQTLQKLDNVDVEIYDDGEQHVAGVDEQLIVIAKKLGARLCTTDYNLNKVARVESIDVVNVNELAHALRPMHLPGERLSVGIVQRGQNADQGVGYLDDGTMVVVDNARRAIGEDVEVEAVRMLQTEAGRMLFAKRVGYVAPRDTSTKTKQPEQKKQSHSQRNRRKSPEDNLVELANK
jgi:uncharacterized protein YacL